MTTDNLFIVELCLESGTPFKRSCPMEKQRTDRVAAKYNAHFKTAVVPAEKYPTESRGAETLENIQTNNGFRSRVE